MDTNMSLIVRGIWRPEKPTNSVATRIRALCAAPRTRLPGVQSPKFRPPNRHPIRNAPEASIVHPVARACRLSSSIAVTVDDICTHVLIQLVRRQRCALSLRAARGLQPPISKVIIIKLIRDTSSVDGLRTSLRKCQSMMRKLRPETSQAAAIVRQQQQRQRRRQQQHQHQHRLL